MYFQKTMFLANPGTHQQPVRAPFSTARPVAVVHPAGGGEPGKVQSGGHQRTIASAEESATGALHRGGVPVRAPKIHPPQPAALRPEFFSGARGGMVQRFQIPNANPHHRWGGLTLARPQRRRYWD